jgi:hypothetical protein|tara:strand:+ start:318 stop:488 length:171 start_codon:yes stop_codon:yes gene_type:complete
LERRRLLVPGVDEAKVHFRNNVQHRQDVVAGPGKDVGYSFQLEVFADQVAAGNTGY